MQYIRVGCLSDALSAFREGGSTRYVAGGTDLLVKMRAGMVTPDLLLDISEIEALHGIRVTDRAIDIGAATPIETIRRHPEVGRRFPLLKRVLDTLGSVQIRWRATLAGNLVNASPAADTAIPLLLYDARLAVEGHGGQRDLPIHELFRAPGDTSLQPSDLVTAVRLPLQETNWAPFFHKVGRRRALTISIASVGALVEAEHGVIRSIRLAAGSVAPVPLRFPEIEGELIGRAITDDAARRAARRVAESTQPISDVRASGAYRRDVVEQLIARLLRTTIGA